MRKEMIIFVLIIGFTLATGLSNVSAQNTICCEKTNSGAYCQNVPAEECDPGYRQVPTSCDATSFCQEGTCYDSTEGTCADNTPQLVCNQNGGVWSLESPPQCGLGCCTLGDQAAFVTLVRCKRLSSFLGLQTDYNQNINNELECIASVQGQEKGACVFETDFERDCDFTTKEECNLRGDGEFYSGTLCSAEELGTICGPTTETMCAPGKDEVYFKDTCGNPGNIYDATKVEDQEYWTNVKRKDESCGFGQGNANNRDCGNCDYLEGSFCRDENSAGTSPRYGDYICADLNCIDESGQERNHGESWCISDDKGGNGQDRVGSRFFRYLCINGEVVSEPCADFRNEVCIEEVVETSGGEFSQAACRVNRWQDCLAQTEEDDCLNTDRRDCYWNDKAIFASNKGRGVCLPVTSPGLEFWNSEESQGICAQANVECVVTFEKGLFGGEECKDNCECIEEGWIERQGEVCTAIGDCGYNVNWAGDEGYKKGYEYRINGKLQKNR
ncbi:hypothetical protein COY00_01575 [Candidatus Pacearchaeota archaeon CG_4_10_14_0_2_um_filter_35_33]|nr:hypothetical protein [Candidatus Pacearchaeota archaeon]PIZ80140.1 MAG: hypothetical protein COY00_01575 [Candidatus Pacearchaeota archaeon CG_4_10_14_0_2_um_filter_35_33]